jgi:hypothetical protein
MSAFSRLTAGDANVVLIDESESIQIRIVKIHLKKTHGIRCKRFETFRSL